MKLLLVLFAAACWADDAKAELVKVEEIPLALRTAIRDADQVLQMALADLDKAQKEAAKAKAMKAESVAAATRQHSPYEGECKQSYSHGMTWASAYRQYRRASVNGRFVLVTEGSEACNSLTYFSTTGGIGVSK